MQQSCIQVNSVMKFDYKRCIRLNHKLIDPYVDERFQYKNIEQEAHKVEKLKNMAKRTNFDDWNKIFDDASLTYDAQRPEFLDYRKIDLSNSQITENGISHFTRSEYSQNVEEIDLSQNPLNINDLALRYLSDSHSMTNLQILLLNDTGISDIGIMYLFQPFTVDVDMMTTGQAFRQTKRTFVKKVIQPSLLTTLKSTNAFDNASTIMHSEVESQYSLSSQRDKLPNLKALSLYGNLQITDRSLRCIAFSNSIRLSYLDVRYTSVSDVGVSELLGSVNSELLQFLDISYQGNQITNATIEAFADSEYCKSLVVLRARNCRIDDDALEILAESENSQTIEELDVCYVNDNRKRTIRRQKEAKSDDIRGFITDKGMRSLTRAKFFGRLSSLNLSGLQISDGAYQDFAVSDTMKSIKQLFIGSNLKVNDSVLETLGKSEKSRDMEKLSITVTAVTEDGIDLFQELRQDVQIVHSITQLPSIRQSNHKQDQQILSGQKQYGWNQNISM